MRRHLFPVGLVEKVDAIGEGESEAAGAVTFAVMVAQVACLCYEGVEWFDGRHVGSIINHLAFGFGRFCKPSPRESLCDTHGLCVLRPC